MSVWPRYMADAQQGEFGLQL